MNPHRIAFLWEESYLWGLMAYKALKALNLPFSLLRAEDIRAGALRRYQVLFVPGGWASNKSRALEEHGMKAIRDFVAGGGSYLGFCGGAGLAAEAQGGIGLLSVQRRPTKERVPSFSGQINLHLRKHALWDDLPERSAFHAWWPSQFVIKDAGIRVLATYGDALPGSFSSDLNVGDVEACGDWSQLEATYGINLNPARLKDEPAVIEGTYGKGRVILSLIHFDTPGDTAGQHVLSNLWGYLAGQRAGENVSGAGQREKTGNKRTACSELHDLCSGLISLGLRNFLWFWRNPMLLQWRRGIRGLEYNTLYVMMKEINERLQNQHVGSEHYFSAAEQAGKLLVPVVDHAKKLLIRERYALQKGTMTYERCDDAEIRKMRAELFSDSKSHGGKFKEALDAVDDLLYQLLTERSRKPDLSTP